MEKISFKLPDGQIEKLNFKRNAKNKFLARCSDTLRILKIGHIAVSELFFEFNTKQQTVIIFHEIWHRDFARKRYFRNNEISKLEEFEADKYSAIMTSKKDVISTLSKFKKYIKKGIIKNHEIDHPSIEERIKRIIELNIKKTQTRSLS